MTTPELSVPAGSVEIGGPPARGWDSRSGVRGGNGAGALMGAFLSLGNRKSFGGWSRGGGAVVPKGTFGTLGDQPTHRNSPRDIGRSAWRGRLVRVGLSVGGQAA